MTREEELIDQAKRIDLEIRKQIDTAFYAFVNAERAKGVTGGDLYTNAVARLNELVKPYADMLKP